jgi:D-alanine transfer protein
MTAPRFWSAVAALLLLIGILSVATRSARRLEARHIHGLAPQMFAQKNRGEALQRAAFRQPDLLPLYGSSDLNAPSPYHASALFREYPTGFTVFPIGNAGSTSLIWLQAVAAVGCDLRGKKIAVSLPARSFMNETVDRHAYGANFSRLHASELAFSTCLGFAVKQAAARRMLQFPETVADDPLLRFALEQLADGSLSARLLYGASLPLGKLRNVILRLQDHWETLAFVRAQRGLRPVPRHRVGLSWAAVLSRAEQAARRKADSNPFGFDNAVWAAHAAELSAPPSPNLVAAAFTSGERSAEWTDADLLLRAIRDLGGEPLILSMPMNGTYYDSLGVPLAARQAYYDRLRQLAAAHAVPVIDFADHDADAYFTVDSGLHLSAKGWVYYAHALDAFFHDRQPGTL